MSMYEKISGYKWDGEVQTCAHPYLLPALNNILIKVLRDLNTRSVKPRLFDLGCGNGVVANYLHQQGWEVAGVDPSDDGINIANKVYKTINLQKGSASDNLSEKFGTFPVVISLEVIEHVYSPKKYAQTIYSLLEPGGIVIISTPYHSYLKNLVMAITGRLDAHFTALWEGGHIKFWSKKTISILLKESGFEDLQFKRVGRIPILAKSMLIVANKSDKKVRRWTNFQ